MIHTSKRQRGQLLIILMVIAPTHGQSIGVKQRSAAIATLLHQSQNGRQRQDVAFQEALMAREERRKDCERRWPAADGASPWGHDKGAFMKWCTGDSSSSIAQGQQAQALASAYFDGITEEFLMSIEARFGPAFMEWWASSGAIESSPIRVHTDSSGWVTEVLTPIEMVEEFRSLHLWQVGGPQGESARQDLLRAQQDLLRAQRMHAGVALPSNAAEFFPTGFYDTLIRVGQDGGKVRPPTGQIQSIDTLLEPTYQVPGTSNNENSSPVMVTGATLGDVQSHFGELWHSGDNSDEEFVASVVSPYVAMSTPDLVESLLLFPPAPTPNTRSAVAERLSVSCTNAPSSAFQQYFIHGVLSAGDVFTEEWITDMGGDPTHRLEWNATTPYVLALAGDQHSFQEEVRRLSDAVAATYTPGGPPVLLHGHSAGGVAADALGAELAARGVPVAGIVSYGTPVERLRPSGMSNDIPLLAVGTSTDLVLQVDAFGTLREQLPRNVHAVTLPDTVGFYGADHFFSDYSMNPLAWEAVQGFAAGVASNHALSVPASFVQSMSGNWEDVGTPVIDRNGCLGMLLDPKIGGKLIAPAQAMPGDVVKRWGRDGEGQQRTFSGIISGRYETKSGPILSVYGPDQDSQVVGKVKCFIDCSPAHQVVIRIPPKTAVARPTHPIPWKYK